MKKLLVILSLGFALAISAQPPGISIALIPADPPFGAYFLVAFEQLADYDAFLLVSGDMDAPIETWYRAAHYSCYTERQWVVGTFPQNFYPTTFFQASGNPCPPPPPDPLAFILNPLGL